MVYRFPSFKHSNYFFFHEQYDGVNGKMFWWLMKRNEFLTVSWLSGLLSAEIFISTGEWGVQMPPLTSENSHFLLSGPQEATLVMALIYRGVLFHNNSQEKAIARRLGRGMCVFCEVVVHSFTIKFSVLGAVYHVIYVWYHDISRVYSISLRFVDSLISVPCRSKWYFPPFMEKFVVTRLR